jgi:hypothetical protein
LILGNGSKDFVSFEPPITAAGKARYFIAASFYPGRLPGLLLAFLAGFFMPRRASLALRASLAGTALATVMLFNALASADHIDSTDRYLFPFGLAYFLAVSLVAAGAVADPTTRRARSVTAMALVVAVLGLQIALPPNTGEAFRFPGHKELPSLLIQTRDVIAPDFFVYFRSMDALKAATNPPQYPDPADAPYPALQGSVPEHATLLVLLDLPSRLDFKRNRVFLLDQPGNVSPPPHLPIGQGPQALARYLLDQGVRYVAYSSHYNYVWEDALRGPVPPRDGKSAGPSARTMARLYVDVATNLQKLTATRKLLYADNGVYVLDLATPAPAPP